jgi:hypothetical protein
LGEQETRARELFCCGEEEGKLVFVRLEFPGEQRKKLNLGNQVKLNGLFNGAMLEEGAREYK